MATAVRDNVWALHQCLSDCSARSVIQLLVALIKEGREYLMDCISLCSFNSKYDCYGELEAFFSEYHYIFCWFDCCSLDCHEGAPSCHTYRNCYQKGHSWRHCEPGHANCCFKCTVANSKFDPNGSILPCYYYCDSVERHLVNSKPKYTSYQYRCPKD